MKFIVLDTRGFPYAVEGARMSFNSQGKSDSNWELQPNLGEADHKLLLKLIKEGDSAAKCMRFVVVWIDIQAPRYWWQEFDTYKVGIERLSESTMHTIMTRDLQQWDFEDEIDKAVLDIVNYYIHEKDFRKVKQHLPESFLQRRLIVTNYQALRHMYRDRHNHRLPEWQIFCNYIKEHIAYSDLITVGIE